MALILVPIWLVAECLGREGEWPEELVLVDAVVEREDVYRLAQLVPNSPTATDAK